MFADINGNPTSYQSYGEGPPVVFIHGLGGTSNCWHGVMQSMQQHHHCVALDLRGSGRSAGKGKFSIEGWAQDVAKLIQTLELPAVTLVGHSMGSLVAQYMAWKHSDLVETLVLVGGISWFTPPIADAYRARAESVEKDGMDSLVDGWLEGAVSPQTKATQAGAVGLLREMFLRNDPAMYAKACQALATAPNVRRDEIGQPTLLLTGQYDKSTPLGMTAELKADIPVATIRVLKDVAHWAPVEDPSAVAQAILDYRS